MEELSPEMEDQSIFLPQEENQKLVVILVQKNDSILTLKVSENPKDSDHFKIQKKHRWALPYGKIMKGEDVIKGARRQLFQITGLIVPEDSIVNIKKSILKIRKRGVFGLYLLHTRIFGEGPTEVFPPQFCHAEWFLYRHIQNLPLLFFQKEALLRSKNIIDGFFKRNDPFYQGLFEEEEKSCQP